MSKVQSLLIRTSSTKAKIIGSDDEMFELFKKEKCSTKTDMMMVLYNLGHSKGDIAITLLNLGVLSERSYRQHVRNTIERKIGK